MKKIFFLIGLVFTYLNYSKVVWQFFYNLGGLSLAKVAPEGMGVIVFTLLAFFSWKAISKSEKLIQKKDIFISAVILLVAVFARIPQLRLYFYNDDFYFWFCKECGGYSVYNFEPWLSSHPGLAWEIVKYFASYNPIPYWIVTLFSNGFFGIGIYFLSKSITKNRVLGFFSALFFLTTTLHFETFQWASHVIGFGWQGFFMSLSLLALLWQVEKRRNELPYISSFLMMAAIGSGVARTGALPLILSLLDILLAFKRLGRDKKTWLIDVLKRQFVLLSPLIIFAFTRGLFVVRAIRPEEITAPLYKIFLFLVGLFTFPPEVIGFFKDIIPNTILHKEIYSFFGSVYGLLAMIYLIILISFIVYRRLKNKVVSILEIGILWTLSFAFFYALWGPHVPVTNKDIFAYQGPHHLAYPSSVGVSLIAGFIIYVFLEKIRKNLKKFLSPKIVSYFLIFLSLIFWVWMGLLLRNRYQKFAKILPGRKITEAQFFYEAYRKIIPKDADLINIYFDNVQLVRLAASPHPDSRFFKAFWPNAQLNVLRGYVELDEILSLSNKSDTFDETLDSIYYILVDYKENRIEDLSPWIRDKITKTGTSKVDEKEWETLWVTPKPTLTPNWQQMLDEIPTSCPNEISLKKEKINPENENFYSLKRALEKVTLLALGLNSEWKIYYLQRLLNIRLSELMSIVEKNDKRYIEKASLRYSATAGQIANLQEKRIKNTERNRIIIDLLSCHVSRLEKMAEKFSPTSAEYRFIRDDINSLKIYIKQLR